MKIALFTSEPISSMELVTAGLTDEKIDVRLFDLNSHARVSDFSSDINKVVLVVPRHGAGDETMRVRALFTHNTPLIVCTTRSETEGYRDLKSAGASEIITPRTWAPEHISERILGQLILDGAVEPVACGILRGATRAMQDTYTEMAVIAPLADPVLIVGETGTGKELVAQELHTLSKRQDKFLPINCGELRAELAGSELFGHKRGSFTGATDARQGLFAEAGKGTIFLDEIGELDLKAQAILLRVLEEKKVRRIGSNQTESVSARIVLATNRDLELECEKKTFRLDLFERIRGFSLELHPLRERRADIPLLVRHFLADWNREKGSHTRIPTGALDCLFNYDWPGNVRELRAAVRRAAAFEDAEGYLSSWELLQATRRKRKRRQTDETVAAGTANHFINFDPAVDAWRDLVERAQRIYFQAVLADTRGNKREAQRRSGLGTSQFYEKLKLIPQAKDAEDDKGVEGT